MRYTLDWVRLQRACLKGCNASWGESSGIYGPQRVVKSREHFLTTYVVGLAALTATVVTWAVLRSVAHHDYWVIALFITCSAVSSQWKVHATRSTTWVMGAAAHMVLIVSLTTQEAIVSAAIAKVSAELWQMRQQNGWRWAHFVVNTSATVLAVCVGSLVFQHLDGPALMWGPTWRVLLAFPVLIVTMLAYHATNITVIVGAVTLTSREMPWSVFTQVTWGTLLPELGIMLVGTLFAALWHYSKPLSLLAGVPLFFSVRAFQAVARLRQETIEAVLKMAESIDYRDTGTAEHSKRLADLSGRLGRLAGLTSEHVDNIILAARVHDLGKIGIGNDILLKQGRLTPDEQMTMQQHPIIGASILSSYSAFQGSLEIVRHHHEQWDGTGYPDGLKGEAIPIGARVISVVDAFDAMTADRPYRRGIPTADAIERLKAGMGTQFDPRLCGLFIQMLVEDGTYQPSAVRQPDLRLIGEETG